MKNKIIKLRKNKTNDLRLDLLKSMSKRIIEVDVSKIHDDKSFIKIIGTSFGMEDKLLKEIQNISRFSDDFGDFIYQQSNYRHSSYLLILNNWSKIQVDEYFEFYNQCYRSRKKEDYLEFFNTLIDLFSTYDPRYPDDELIDFTVFVID